MVSAGLGIPRGVNKDHVGSRAKVITSAKWIRGTFLCHSTAPFMKMLHLLSRSAPLHTARHIFPYNRTMEMERKRWKRVRNLAWITRKYSFLLFYAVTATIFRNVTPPTGSTGIARFNSVRAPLFVSYCKLSHIKRPISRESITCEFNASQSKSSLFHYFTSFGDRLTNSRNIDFYPRRDKVRERGYERETSSTSARTR